MNVIPITLRDSPEILIPVTIKNLKVTRNIRVNSHDIGVCPEALSLSLTCSVYPEESAIGIIPEKAKLNAVKTISITHDIGITSTIRPLIRAEISCAENEIGVSASAATAKSIRYRKLSEVDDLTLAELDNMKLEDIDYIEI